MEHLPHLDNVDGEARKEEYSKFNKYFNFNFILPKVNTDYMRQAQVLNIDKLRLIINLRKFNENVK